MLIPRPTRPVRIGRPTVAVIVPTAMSTAIAAMPATCRNGCDDSHAMRALTAAEKLAAGLVATGAGVAVSDKTGAPYWGVVVRRPGLSTANGT